MNLHIKTGLGIKNYVLDPNSNVEYEIFLTDFSWQIWAKNTKLNISSESVKTKEHIESNSCEKYYFLIDAFYEINFWPNLKKLLQKIDFRPFPLFESFAHLTSASSQEKIIFQKFPWRKASFWYHSRAFHRGKVLECDQCNFSTTTFLHGLKRHKETAHEGIIHKCEECGKKFTQMGTLGAHKRVAHEGLLFSCELFTQRKEKRRAFGAWSIYSLERKCDQM